MEEVEVVTGIDGMPHTVVRQGRMWKVAAKPVHWFERTDWWLLYERLPREGTAYIDVEVWRVQVRLGNSPKSQLVTMELLHDRGGDRWTVRSEDATG